MSKYKLKITSEPIVKLLYQIMYDTHTIFCKAGIKYWAVGGTFLGAIRHNGMIPHDDDMDIAIENKDINRFLDLRSEFEKCGYTIVKVWLGYKIFYTNRPLNGRHKYSFPNVDIFPMKEVDNKLIPLYKSVREMWPKEWYPTNELYPLKKYKFADFWIYGPAEHQTYFDRAYNKDWNKIMYRDYDHEEEEVMEKVKVKITPKDRVPAKPTNVKDRHCISKIKIPPIELKQRLVVSMTTIPSRIDVLYKTVKNIMKQTQLIDKIYLNIPYKSSKGDKYVIPEKLKTLVIKSKESGIPVVFNRPKEDYGPGTKLYPTLLKEKNPNTLIVTIDDDMIYDSRMIETLVKEFQMDQSRTIGLHGWNIGPKGKMWDLDECSGDYTDIIEGFGGALYSKKFFMKKENNEWVDKSDSFIRMRKKVTECFFVDDVYISAWLSKNNIPIYLANKPDKYKEPKSHSESSSALSDNPKVEERNKKCVMNFVKYFKNRGKNKCYNKGGYAWK